MYQKEKGGEMISVDFTKKFFILVICILPLIGCEAYLPKAFQEEEFGKDFDISPLDDKACESLNDSLSVIISTSLLTDFDSTWVDSLIYNDSLGVYEYVEEILDSLEAHEIMVTDSDTSFTIITPEDVDSNYVAFSTESDEVVFFFSDFVDMNIIDTAGTVLEAESKAISLETIYYGVSPDTVYQDTIITDITDCSKLKTRIVYKLSENRNLVQIIKTDQTTDSTFTLVVLPK